MSSNHVLCSLCDPMSFLGVICRNVLANAIFVSVHQRLRYVLRTFCIPDQTFSNTGLNDHWARFHGVNELLSTADNAFPIFPTLFLTIMMLFNALEIQFTKWYTSSQNKLMHFSKCLPYTQGAANSSYYHIQCIIEMSV